jgi:tryptophan-rich sensory protein
MDSPMENQTSGRLVSIGLLSWLSMLGVDFFLHGGLLAGLYVRTSPFLLPPEDAFRLIPVGYFAFLLLASLLLWLILRLQISGWKSGLVFGFQLGLMVWGALMLGLASISTADLDLLTGWWLGQTVEMGVAGAVAGHGLRAERLGRTTLSVIGLVIFLMIVTIVMQNVGLAPVPGAAG